MPALEMLPCPPAKGPGTSETPPLSALTAVTAPGPDGTQEAPSYPQIPKMPFSRTACAAPQPLTNSAHDRPLPFHRERPKPRRREASAGLAFRVFLTGPQKAPWWVASVTECILPSLLLSKKVACHRGKCHHTALRLAEPQVFAFARDCTLRNLLA